MTNKCLKCGKDKTLVGKKSPILVCIDCKGAARRERYKNDEEYRNKRKASMKGYAPKWRKKHPEKAMLHRAKRRAKQSNIEFNITVEDIVIPKLCPILNIPLISDSNKITDNSASLDRIDSSKGYIKGNVGVISFRANTIKSNATYEELIKVAEYLKNISLDKSKNTIE